MRILADENVAAAVVMALRSKGDDVSWIAEFAPGSSDGDVLSRAAREQRLMLTHDKEFAAMAAARKSAGLAGVILLRLEGMAPSSMAELVAAALSSRGDWRDHFSVIGPARIRMKKLPVRR